MLVQLLVPSCAVLCGVVMSDLLLQKLMVEPVIAADGHTYERSAMKHWLMTVSHVSMSPTCLCLTSA